MFKFIKIIKKKKPNKKLKYKIKKTQIKIFDAHKQKVYVKLKLKSPIFQILGEYVVDKICPLFF